MPRTDSVFSKCEDAVDEGCDGARLMRVAVACIDRAPTIAEYEELTFLGAQERLQAVWFPTTRVLWMTHTRHLAVVLLTTTLWEQIGNFLDTLIIETVLYGAVLGLS